MTDPAAEHASLTARLEIFKAALPSLTDEELFETLHAVEREKQDARTGYGEGELQELLLKEENLEAEISRRHPEDMLGAYEKWLGRHQRIRPARL